MITPAAAKESQAWAASAGAARLRVHAVLLQLAGKRGGAQLALVAGMNS